MLPQLLEVIARRVPLSLPDIELCSHAFEAVSLKKNAVVEAVGEVPQHLYFIGTGYMRLFYSDADGDEVTTHLGAAHDFLTPFLSFIHQQRAPENLACITACTVLRISRPRLVALIEASAAFKAFSLLIFEQAIADTSRRANSLATLTAEQRYRQLATARPDLILHVPVNYLASYLGISRESLSRIRRQVKQ